MSASRSFRVVPAGAALQWWAEGWQAFMRAPLPWIGLAVALMLILWLLGKVPLGGLLSQWVSLPLMALGAVFATVLRQRWARARDITPPGMPVEPDKTGALAQSTRNWREQIGPLLLASLLVLVLGGLFAAVFVIALGAVFGVGVATMSAFSHALTPGESLQALGAAAGALLTLALLVLLALYLLNVAFWFVNTLVVLGGASAWEAIVLSFRAGFANILPITLFTLILLPVAIAAMIPAGLGLLVLLPVLSGASAASYHQVFGADDRAATAGPNGPALPQ